MIDPSPAMDPKHYDVAVLPRRSGRATGKARSGGGDQPIQISILLARHEIFFSLETMNAATRSILIDADVSSCQALRT